MDDVTKAHKRPRKEEEELSTIPLCLPITAITATTYDPDGNSIPSTNTEPPPPPPPPPAVAVAVAIPNNKAS
eukprot:scaffold68964_cov36-Attheya_sp.AAC.1